MTVLDAATSNAVADAAIKISVREQTGTLLQGSYNREFKTGPAGIVEIPIPEEGLDRLQLQASATNYTSRLVAWVKTNNEAVPASHTFYLKGSFAIGGTIVDEEGNPVSGARISVSRTYSTPEEYPWNQKGERDEISSPEVTTGSDGTWIASGLAYGARASLTIGVRHPEFLYKSVWLRDAEPAFLAKAHRLTLSRGESISGRVVGPDDQPVAGARIRGTTRTSTDTNEVTSDMNGRFRLSRLGTNSYERSVSVTAKGFAPLQQTLPLSESKEELLFRLKAGSKLAVRLQTPEGQPVSGAEWFVNLPRDGNTIGRWEVRGLTAEDGRFEFEAEEGATYLLNVFAREWETIRERNIKATVEEQIVTMRARRKLSVQVVDVDTGAPITKGTFSFGIYYGPTSIGGRVAQPFENSEGRFEVGFTEERENAIKVSADDHETVTVRLNEPDFAAQPFVVRLKPSPSLKGVVRTKAGRVLPGAIVAGVGGANFVSIRSGTIVPMGNSEGFTRTDAQGRFSLQLPPGVNTLVASGDGLFGNASVDEVKNSGEIILGGNGKISGAITLNGKPVVGRRLQVLVPAAGISTQVYAESDQSGKFMFPEVPAGRWAVVEMIPGRSAGSYVHGERVEVEVVPSEIAEVVIAKTGVKVVGRLVPVPTAAAQLVSVTLRSGPPLRFVVVNPGPPVEQQIKEWQGKISQVRSISASVQQDGTFVFEAVAPGEYQLGAAVFEATSRMNGGGTIVVPAASNDSDQFDVGQVLLKEPSSPAPKP